MEEVPFSASDIIHTLELMIGKILAWKKKVIALLKGTCSLVINLLTLNLNLSFKRFFAQHFQGKEDYVSFRHLQTQARRKSK
jgi:hypothetical protein